MKAKFSNGKAPLNFYYTSDAQANSANITTDGFVEYEIKMKK